MSLIFVYITNPTRTEARKISTHLLERKLIACANIFQVESIYPWKGRIRRGKEFVVIGKTESAKYAKIVKEIEKIHPYDIPCIVKIPTRANDKFSKWVRSCVK